jgi:hypothetical protein
MREIVVSSPVRKEVAVRTIPSSVRARCLAFGLAATCLLPVVVQAQSQLDRFQLLAMDRGAFRVKAVALLPVDTEAGQRMVYGDRYGVVRVVRLTGDGAREIWRSRTLEGGAVLEVLAEDLDDNESVEIVARTQQGRMVVFDELFNARWESLPEDYNQISAMAIANMDNDRAYEIVVLADGTIDYIDGSQFNREYRSTQQYRATEMAIGNVDTDFDLEIVLNTGTVIDAISGEPEWETDSFGQFVELLDLDGDGMQEILGHTANQFMRIFDADLQQEKPLQ